MNNKEKRGAALLTLASVLWGSTFVAQSVGLQYMGPFTFVWARSVLASVLLFSWLLVSGRLKEKPADRRSLWLGGFLIGTFLFAASALQQAGMAWTSVGKSGFLTALYLVMVPVAGIFLGKRPGSRLWCSILLALLGMYFLCLAGQESELSPGDGLILLAAVAFTFQILLVGKYSGQADAVKLCCLEFFFCALEATFFALPLERPTGAQLLAGALPLLYAGIVSNCFAYTLQIIGQRDVPSSVSAVIMSMESVFSLLAGWIVLGQKMTGRELFGCALIFAAVLLSQLPEKKHEEDRGH